MTTIRVSFGVVAPPTILCVLLVQLVVAGQPNNADPVFEEVTVAGINPSIRNHEGRQLTTTTFVDRADLLEFILSAYFEADGAGVCGLKLVLVGECVPIIGPLPGWMRSSKFEVSAKLPTQSLPVETIDRLRDFRFTSSARKNVFPLPLRLMLQRLLEETFEFRVHRERRQIPVYAVTAQTNEPTLMRSSFAATGGMGTNGLVSGRRLPSPRPPAPDDPVQLVFEGSTVKDATDFFSAYLDRPVIDRTGLDGEYNFTLEFKGNSRGSWPRGGVPLMAGFDAARLVQAFEGVGFKVDSTTALFEILIIESSAQAANYPNGQRQKSAWVGPHY